MTDGGMGSTAGARGLKGAARDLFKRHIATWLWVRPRDRWLFWSVPPPGPDAGPSVDILRIGSCEDRAMPRNHQANGPLGVPRFMIGQLAHHGVAVGYQNMWVWAFEELPKTRKALLKRRRMNRPAPDLIIFQVGPIYSGKHFLGGHRRIIGLRENMGKRIGPLIFPLWRVISKALRWAGLPTLPFPGREPLDAFLELVCETWPDTIVAIYEPTTPALEGGINRRKAEDIAAALAAAAERRGPNVRLMPRPDLGTDMRLRISNGFNLNESGARVVGRHLADWIRAQPDVIRVRAAEPVYASSDAVSDATV